MQTREANAAQTFEQPKKQKLLILLSLSYLLHLQKYSYYRCIPSAQLSYDLGYPLQFLYLHMKNKIVRDHGLPE